MRTYNTIDKLYAGVNLMSDSCAINSYEHSRQSYNLGRPVENDDFGKQKPNHIAVANKNTKICMKM